MNAELTAEFTERAGVFRRELLAFCYQMLGSAEDAEEVVQETRPQRLALLRHLRGALVTAHLAVPDRRPGLPEGARRRQTTAVAVGLRPHFAQDTERWISGPARISTSKAADPASQKGATR